MKTGILFLGLVLYFTSHTTALAQEVDFGIKAGVNYATLSGVEGGETNYLPGFHGGFTAQYVLYPKFAVQAELLYSLEGAESSFKRETEEYSFSSEQKLRLGFLNLPIMGKLYVTEGFSLQAGPQVGYLLSAKNEYSYSSAFPEDSIIISGTGDIREELKKVLFGLNFGIGYDLNSALFLQARYYLGLSDINNYDDQIDDIEVDFKNIRNQGFQLSVGCNF